MVAGSALCGRPGVAALDILTRFVVPSARGKRTMRAGQARERHAP
jgi:hypothetical protein